MSNLTIVTVSVTADSNVVTVTSGENINSFGAGDLIYLQGVFHPFQIINKNGNHLIINENAGVSDGSLTARLTPSLIEIRQLSTDIRESNEFTANVFGQLDFFLTQLGTVDIESPSGITSVNTLPQILFDVSQASDQVAANVALIANAPLNAQQAADSATTAEESNQSSIEQVTLATQQAEQAAAEKQAVIEEGQRIDIVAQDIATLEQQIQENADIANQSVIDAAEQVALGEGIVGTVTDLRDEVTQSLNQVQQLTEQAEQAVEDAQEIAGGNFATVSQLEEVRRRATAAGIGYL